MLSLTFTSETETEALGRKLAGILRLGDLVWLVGDLGAGKTTLARGLIRALAGAEIDVASPTFALIQTYELDTPVFHVDLYRLDSADQAYELGLEELGGEGIMLVEWPERAPSLLPPPRLEIDIVQGKDESRMVTLTPRGGNWAARVEALAAGMGQ